jgi:hypothetical protein
MREKRFGHAFNCTGRLAFMLWKSSSNFLRVRWIMKAILLYMILVGVPVLGILGLLRVGQRVSAPISLVGKWSAQLTPPNPQDLAGDDSLLRPGSTSLRISQSGSHLLLSFGDGQNTTFVGNIQDMTINAGLVRKGDTGPDRSDRTTAAKLNARVDRQTDPDRLVGIVIFDYGSISTEVLLTATRQNGVSKSTGEQ